MTAGRRLVSAVDIVAAPRNGEAAAVPVLVCEDAGVRVTAVAVTHGHAAPALAYRFDTADGSVVFSGDTTVNESLISLATGADILVHQVADLDYLARHGVTGADLEHMAGLHTDVRQVGAVAERAHVGELILNHDLPAEPGAITEADWARRAGQGFSGITTAGRDGLRRALRSATGLTGPRCRPPETRMKTENRYRNRFCRGVAVDLTPRTAASSPAAANDRTHALRCRAADEVAPSTADGG